MRPEVPTATVQRLPLYLGVLERLPDDVTNISSDEMAAEAGVTPAKLRKDLSHLGSYGTRGVGYPVDHLRFQIRQVLGLNRTWSVVIVGIGNLGRALSGFRGFGEEGFDVVALFDADPEVIGTPVAGLEVLPVDRLAEVIAEESVDIGVITVPARAAQEVATALADAGVRSILNFARTVLKVPDDVDVRRVDLSNELQVLSYYLHRAGGG
ncbi:MAG: redox-sensing transcriptional repressor Rex [Acidimicrobiia bacterium]|nr:redox-sensing transcriptional repressor Rex [Acidimicrobiia bacterium]